MAVKEFRQAVQSRWVVAVLILFLLLNLTVVGGYLLLSPDIQTDTDGGQGVFAALMAILAFTCMGFVPAYTGIRLSLERHSTDIDLFFITTITPGAIVRGKYLTAMAITLLIFSTCMPFMVLTYLLRGIDLPTIFMILASCFVLCAAANALGLFAGAVSGGWLIRGLVAIGAAIILIYLAFGVAAGLQAFMFFGPGVFGLDIEVWIGIATFLALEAMGIGLLYVFSVALLSPRPTNRMMVPRLYLTACWAATGGVAAGWSHFEDAMWPVIVWLVLSSFALVGPGCGRVGRARRLECPCASCDSAQPIATSRGISRLYGLGRRNAVVHDRVSGYATGGLGLEPSDALVYGPERPDRESAELPAGVWICPVLLPDNRCVASPAVFSRADSPPLGIRHGFWGRRVSGAVYACLFAGANWWSELPWYMLGSPLVLAEVNAPSREIAGLVVFPWVVLSGMACVPWALEQWRRFTPYRGEAEA